MAKKVFNMQGGLHSAAAYSAFENRLNGSVKASPDSFIVSAAAGMNVSVSTGDGIISVDAFNARRIQITTAETVAISPANATNARIDSVVAYIDTTVQPTTSVIDNINDILKLKSVAGTAATTPVAPTAAAIQSSIGAGNPYMVLANVTVPAAATNMAGATFDNIAPTPLLKSWPINSVYISIDPANPSTLFGGKWVAFATGRTLVGIDATQTEFNTIEKTGGTKAETLTTAQIPSHRHRVYTEVGTQTNLADHPNYRQVAGPTAGTRALVTDSTELIGGGGSHNNLPPYITTYMWKRTA